MKILIVIVIFILQVLVSCNNSRTPGNQEPENPKALEDKNSLYETVSKRGNADLVESLYKELTDKTPELKALEERMEDLSSGKSDSTGLFDKYNGKNQAFYSSAENHAERITDSVLKEKIKLLIAGSLAKYESSIAGHNGIINSIANREMELNNLHTILKITRTLPLIEKYQKDNLPATKSLEGFYKQLDKLTSYADTLTKNK